MWVNIEWTINGRQHKNDLGYVALLIKRSHFCSGVNMTE